MKNIFLLILIFFMFNLLALSQNVGRVTSTGLRLGSQVAPVNAFDVTGSSYISGTLGLGSSGIVDATIALNLIHSFTANSSTAFGIKTQPQIGFTTTTSSNTFDGICTNPIINFTGGNIQIIDNFTGICSQPDMRATACLFACTTVAKTLTNVKCFNSLPVSSNIVSGAGALTVSNLFHYYVTNSPSGASGFDADMILNNQYGMYIEALTFGTNKYGIVSGSGNLNGFGTLTPATTTDIDGGFTTRPSSVQNLTAASTTVTVGDRSYIRLSSNDAVAANRLIVLPQSTSAGQILTIEWTGTNAATITDDAAQSGGGNMRLSVAWLPTQYDIIQLISNGTDWIETSRSVN